MKRAHLILAAVAMVSVAGLQVRGQERVGSDGHALDASNKVGSGGYNDQTSQPVNSENGNLIVTNNVTGLFPFHGATVNGVNLGAGYTDPSAFRQILPGESVDQFIAESTGVPTEANRTLGQNTTTNQARPYYFNSNTTQTPAGYMALPNGQGYVPAPPPTQDPSDTRLGNVLNTPTVQLPGPDQLYLPGPVDPTANGNPQTSGAAGGLPYVYTASPLFGSMQQTMGQYPWASPGAMGPGGSIQGIPGQPGSGPVGPDQTQRLSQQQLEQYRQQLQNPNQLPGQGNNNLPGSPTAVAGATPLQPLRPTDNTGEALQPVINTGSQVSPDNLSAQSGNMSTGQTNRNYMVLTPPPPGAQSSQYLLLQQRLQAYNASHPATDEEANRQFMDLLRMNRAVAGGANAPGGMGPAAPMNPAPAAPELPTAPAPAFKAPAEAPLQINSLAAGVKAKGLADLISRGETQIQHQQYDRAMDTFDDALQVAPNNALLLIGKADAELGGAYYQQAYMDLHRAFAQDQAVLMGQYNLTSLLGEKRLKDITADLKNISSNAPTNVTAPFLLAFISYNTHQEADAGHWLAAAAKASNGTDAVIGLLQRYWNTTSTSPSK